MVTITDDQISQSAVELASLRDLGQFHQLREMAKLGSNRKVVISQLVSPSLQLFASASNELRDLVILLRESAHVVAELGGLASLLDLNLTCKCSELIDISRSNFFFNSEKLKVELILVLFAQESDKELAGLKYLRAKNSI